MEGDRGDDGPKGAMGPEGVPVRGEKVTSECRDYGIVVRLCVGLLCSEIFVVVCTI